jgi:amino acid permease
MVQKENPSIRTIFTLLSSMIGGAMLTFPILFKTAGIVTGVIVLIVSSFISYKTCRIYVMHLAPSDTDIEDTIRRILGLKWEKFFRLITGFYLVLLNIIYIVLIVDQTYNIIYFIMLKADAKNYIADKKVDHFVFDRFSKQYLSLIMYLPILAATFIKNLSFVIKLASFGIISCFIYSLFLIYQFSATAVHGIDFSQINWVNTNIGELAGTSAIAFTVHTVVTTIVKSNKKQ